MTEGSSVSCWHPPEVQTEWFLADFFQELQLIADCLCESDHGLNKTSARRRSG